MSHSTPVRIVRKCSGSTSAAKPFGQHWKNRTFLELTVMNEKHCPFRQKVHRRRSGWSPVRKVSRGDIIRSSMIEYYVLKQLRRIGPDNRRENSFLSHVG